MSHGGGGDDKPMEPNLTPLLDIVLQLVMFFMLCANFVSNDINKDIVLPTAITAKSLEAKERNILFLNINAKGHILLSSQGDSAEAGALLTPLQISVWLKTQFQDKVKSSNKAEAEKMVVIIRAHEEAKADAIFTILKEVKGAGFKRMQFRAIQKSSLTSLPAVIFPGTIS